MRRWLLSLSFIIVFLVGCNRDVTTVEFIAMESVTEEVATEAVETENK